jgi:hypothetical protein
LQLPHILVESDGSFQTLLKRALMDEDVSIRIDNWGGFGIGLNHGIQGNNEASSESSIHRIGMITTARVCRISNNLRACYN